MKILWHFKNARIHFPSSKYNNIEDLVRKLHPLRIFPLDLYDSHWFPRLKEWGTPAISEYSCYYLSHRQSKAAEKAIKVSHCREIIIRWYPWVWIFECTDRGCEAKAKEVGKRETYTALFQFCDCDDEHTVGLRGLLLVWYCFASCIVPFFPPPPGED